MATIPQFMPPLISTTGPMIHLSPDKTCLFSAAQYGAVYLGVSFPENSGGKAQLSVKIRIAAQKRPGMTTGQRVTVLGGPGFSVTPNSAHICRPRQERHAGPSVFTDFGGESLSTFKTWFLPPFVCNMLLYSVHLTVDFMPRYLEVPARDPRGSPGARQVVEVIGRSLPQESVVDVDTTL